MGKKGQKEGEQSHSKSSGNIFESEKSEKGSSSMSSQKFDLELLAYEHDEVERLCIEADKNGTLESFQKMKFRQEIYEIGEFIHLYDHTNTTPFVARLSEILKITNNPTITAVLKVEWMLRKHDLPHQFTPLIKHLSTAEVFPSNIKKYVYIESLMRKCYILTYKQYEELTNAGDQIHFTRAFYLHENQSLSPPPEQWQQQCNCGNPVNPDLAYIQCEKCQKWIHEECVINKADLDAEVFFCDLCAGE